MTIKRTYQRTHPWINFQLDLRLFTPDLWIRLGEVQSKCEHIAGVPLAPDIAEYLHNIYLAKGAAATTAIEGNTLTEEEVRAYIDRKLSLPKSREYLGREVDNVVEACNALLADLVSGKSDSALTKEKLFWMNAGILENLPRTNDDFRPGEIRQHQVAAGTYRCAPPEDCEHLLERLCQSLNDFPIPVGKEIIYALIKAIYAHLYFVWIHPFGDGNGRTARLLEFYILLSAGLPTSSAHLPSNHYNKTRTEYYRQLNLARDPESGVINFMIYAVQGFLDGLKEQLEIIRHTQWQVAWINYVHKRFKGRNSPADTRKRNVVLALSNQVEPVHPKDLPYLSKELIKAYEGKTYRTITRDINILLEMGLIKKDKGAITAAREMILAFLPWRRV